MASRGDDGITAGDEAAATKFTDIPLPILIQHILPCLGKRRDWVNLSEVNRSIHNAIQESLLIFENSPVLPPWPAQAPPRSDGHSGLIPPFIPLNNRYLVYSCDQSVVLWDVLTGRIHKSPRLTDDPDHSRVADADDIFFDFLAYFCPAVREGATTKEDRVLLADANGFRSFSIHPDNELKLEQVVSFTPTLLIGPLFSCDGKLLLTQSNPMHVYDTESGQKIATFNFELPFMLNGMISPSSKYIAICGGNVTPPFPVETKGTIQLYQFLEAGGPYTPHNSLQLVASWQAHEPYVGSIEFSMDSRYLYSTCWYDGIILAWHTETRRCVGKMVPRTPLPAPTTGPTTSSIPNQNNNHDESDDDDVTVTPLEHTMCGYAACPTDPTLLATCYRNHELVCLWRLILAEDNQVDDDTASSDDLSEPPEAIQLVQFKVDYREYATLDFSGDGRYLVVGAVYGEQRQVPDPPIRLYSISDMLPDEHVKTSRHLIFSHEYMNSL